MVCTHSQKTHNGLLLRHKKEWNFATCDNMASAKWKKSDREDTVWFHLHVETKNQDKL